MGTSSSSRGSRASSPLVPSWADADDNDATLPLPVGTRFRSFRTEFGKYTGGGGREPLTKALGNFARQATGGSSVGPRRYGPAYVAGSGLWGAIRELQDGGSGQESTGVDCRGLVGRDLAFCAQELARALAPENADADRIKVAIQEAMAETFPDAVTFEPESITEEQLVTLMVEFLTRIVFQHVTEEAGDAWNKADSVDKALAAEEVLFDLVHAAVDKHLSPKLSAGSARLSRAQVAAIERDAVTDVWKEWEGFR